MRPWPKWIKAPVYGTGDCRFESYRACFRISFLRSSCFTRCMPKVCRYCLEKKPLDEFSFRSRARGTRHHKCKECQRSYSKAHYEATKHENSARYSACRRVRRRERNQQYRARMFAYLEQHPCVDCGEADPIVLDFDHKGDKAYDVSTMIGQGWAWSRIMQEIKKCVVRCAHCHRRKTAREKGWYAFLRES